MLRLKKNHRMIFAVLLFFVVFNPPIISKFSFTLLAIVLSVIVNFTRIRQTISIIRTPNIKRFIKLIFCFYCYYVFIAIINSIDTDNGSLIIRECLSSLIYTAASISVSLAITNIAWKRRITPDCLISLFITMSLVQCFFCILTFISPSAKQFFTNLMLTDVEPEKQWIFIHEAQFRNFGWASSLYDIFGFAMSLTALLTLFKAYHEKKLKYYCFFIVITFSAVINSRTSLVLIAIGAIFILLWGEQKNRFLKGIIIILVGIAAAILFFSSISTSDSGNSSWLSSGINEIQTMLTTHEATGYFEALIDRFLFFPDDIGKLLFGAGANPMIIIGKNSDVGYIKSIWAYGIIGSVMIYSAFLYLLNCIKNQSKKYSGLFLALIVTFLLYQVKLSSLGYSQAHTIILPLCFYFIYYSSNSIFGDVDNEHINYWCSVQ